MAKKSTTPSLSQKKLKAMLAKAEENLATLQQRASGGPTVDTTRLSGIEQASARQVTEEAEPDSYYVRNPKTGLSPAQEEANAAVAAAAESSKAAGIPAVVLKTPGSANRVSTPPYAAPTGTEWRWVGSTNTNSVAAGSWKLVKLPGTTSATSATDSSGDGDNLGSGTIFRFINGILYANGSPFTGNYQGKKYQDGKQLNQFTNEDGSDSGDGRTYTAPDGKIFTDLNSYNAYIEQLGSESKRRAGQSAYDLLFSEFDRYGLGALVDPLKSFIVEGLSQAEFTLRLRETDAYKKRFAANAQRIAKGLRALSEGEYILLEDKYQDVMSRYGLPESYYKRGDMGRQEGFEKFIAGDVSATELEDRIQTAYNRVINAAPEVSQTLRTFYPEISDGDILAYALDPSKAIENIKRKVTAAEIGGAATQAGLATSLTAAEQLQRYGVTGESARQGYQTISSYLPRAATLGDIYAKQGMGAFTQTTAEAEVFGTPGSAEAAAKRRKLTELEQAQFGGSAGVAGSALGRERAGQF